MVCESVVLQYTMVCGVAINSLEITSTVQPARNDVKIGPGRAHGNTLLVSTNREYLRMTRPGLNWN